MVLAEDKITFRGKIKEYDNVKANITINTNGEIAYYDTLKMNATVKPVNKKYGSYYSDKIYLEAKAKSFEKIRENNNFYKKLYNFKDRISDFIEENFSFKTAMFLKGVMLGDDTLRTDEFSEALRKTGLSHIVVVSGMHFTIINMLLLVFLRRLRIKRKISSLISVLVSFLLAMFIGFTASVMRAFIMLTILNIADIVNRERKTDIYLVSLTAFLMIIINPFIIQNVGFVLSFMSVAGIVIFNEKISVKLGVLPHYIKDVVSVSLSANIGILPFIIYYFKGIPILFILSNFIVTAFMSLIMGYGIIVVTFSFVSVKLAYYIGIPLDYFIAFLTDVILWISEIPYSYIETLNIGKYLIILYYFSLYLFMNLKRRVIKYIVVSLLFLYFSFSVFLNPESYILNTADINVFCGKDSGKVLINYKDKNIFIDLSTTSSNKDYTDTLKGCFKGKTDVFIAGDYYNVKNSYIKKLEAKEIYYPSVLLKDDYMRDIIYNAFDKNTVVDKEIKLKYYDICLTLNLNKSYNVSMVTIEKGREKIIVTNSFENMNSRKDNYIVTYKMLSNTDGYNIINCENQEIERIRI